MTEYPEEFLICIEFVQKQDIVGFDRYWLIWQAAVHLTVERMKKKMQIDFDEFLKQKLEWQDND